MARQYSNINLTQLYAQAFGKVALPPYSKIGNGFEAKIDEDRYEPADFPSNSESKKSALGTPLFMPCKLGGYDLPNEPLIDVKQAVIIIKTELDDDGTFKERWADADYDVTIKGIAVNEDNMDDYPEQIIRKIKDLVRSKKNMEVVCRMTTIFGITKLVIEDATYPAVVNMPAQPYVLKCLSDVDRDLELINP